MSDRYLDNLLPDFGEYSLESVLDEYRKRTPASQQPASEPVSQETVSSVAEAIAQRSRQIVIEALGETLSQRRPSPAADAVMPDQTDGPDVQDRAPEPAADHGEAPDWTQEPAASQGEAQPGRTPPPAKDEPAPEAEPPQPKRRFRISPDGIITLELDIQLPQEEPAEESQEPAEEDAPQAGEPDEEEPPSRGFGSSRRQEPEARERQEDQPSAADRFLTPLVRLFATRIAMRQMQKAEAANWPDPVEYRETEELSPAKAARFYGQQLRPLRFRCRVCFFLCVTLAWICLRFPMAGMLGSSATIQAGVSLVLLLSVMMTTLDIMAAGLRQLFDLRPGCEALAALGAIMSCVDAAMVVTGNSSYLPFCAVGAFSLGAALWGEKLNCLARARSMRAAAISKAPAAMTAEESGRGGRYVCRAQRPITGAVRRSEQPDFCQNTYATAAPILLLVSLLLAVGASVNGQGAYFLHTLSALLSVSASFTAFLSFPLPYSMIARKLQGSGAAIAGYEGCADIGRSRRVVLSDSDLFPPGTMKLSGINILEGAFVDKVISCTASLLQASGSGASSVFMELVTRRGYSSVTPEEFRCHEGGGLSARVGGEQVLVGSVGFMNLMGIRLPQNMTVKNAVCTAISGELVGVFTLDYIPVSSVQEALVTLLQGRTQPIFAIRDFNITPLMIRQLFRMPTDNFNFPTFRDRYRLANSAVGTRSPVAAVLSRGGMGPLVDAAESGRKLYSTCRIGTVLSLIGTAVGMVTMFLLCRAGAYDTANAGNVLSYMFLWALPVVFLAYGQSR